MYAENGWYSKSSDFRIVVKSRGISVEVGESQSCKSMGR